MGLKRRKRSVTFSTFSFLDAKPQPAPVPTNAPLNRMTYPARLGLARALSKETEDFKEAELLYNDVIVMAPEVRRHSLKCDL